MPQYDLSLDPSGVEAQQIERRRQLAELLVAQGMNGPPAFSPKGGIAKALMIAMGQMDAGAADREQKALAERHAAGRRDEMGRIIDTAQGGDRAALAKLLAQSSEPAYQQAGLGMLMKGPSKITWEDMGDSKVGVDESGNVVKVLPKGVSPDTKYGKETVSADTRFGKETVGAEARLSDERARAEGAANRGLTARGQDMVNARSIDQNTIANSNKNVQLTEGIRKEFEALPEVKNYKAVVPIIQSAKKAPNTPAGDIDLIYAVGKVMDPNSVVREGELNLVIAAGSPAQKLTGFVNYVKGGGRLGPEQRAQLMATLDNRTDALKGQYEAARGSYSSILQKQGLDPEQVFTQIGTQAGPKPGTVVDGFRFKGGNPNDRASWEPA